MRQSGRIPHGEGLESREMMSVIPIILAQSQSLPAAPTLDQLSATAEGGTVSKSAVGSTATQTNEFIIPPVGVAPTPQELKREQFTFSFSGKYVIGPPRFENQSMTIIFRGVGTSTYFLHGDDQVGIVVPKDPTSLASGNSTSYDRNNNSNSAFSFDMIAVPGALDSQGRPTQFTVATDFNASAGIFDEATSSGLLTIKYQPGKHERNGNIQGNTKVTIAGLAYTLGTVSNLSVIGSNNSLDPNQVNLAGALGP